MVKKNYYVGQVFRDLYLAGRYYTIVKVLDDRIKVRGNSSGWVSWSLEDVDYWLGSPQGLQDISFSKYLEAL